ncbi:MAG TPA: LD-carboxypeptidase [Myxococcota bacterium]|nr:LD-carboxypeptidase [Myxococcota bacterium]
MRAPGGPAAGGLVRPRAVPPGGTLGLVAPAGPFDAARLEAGEALLHAAGFRTVRAPGLLDRRGYLAGDDAARAAALMALVDDPTVDAIVCVRGGYGCHRIVTRLDAARVRAAAKPLVGYSDVTTLLLWQRRCAGLVAFHGPMLERGGAQEPSVLAALAAALTGGGPEEVVLTGEPAGGGVASGPLVGGSLTTLVASLGTPWEIDTTGAILLLEEVNEFPYRIDRLLQQLLAAGKLDAAAGFGVGHLVDCVHTRYPEPTARDVVLEILAPLGKPLVVDLPFGHGEGNLPWPVGVGGRLDAGSGELVILERGVTAER